MLPRSSYSREEQLLQALLNIHNIVMVVIPLLIEGKPGMGKTTYCKKVVFDWATQKRATKNYLAKFRIVLLIKCREVQSDLWEAIDDQLLPRDIGDDQRKRSRFLDYIRHNQSKLLLVLDGLDEVSERKLSMFLEIIQGRVLPKCRVVVTARHKAGVKVRKYCDTLLEVEGFTEEDVETFIEITLERTKTWLRSLSNDCIMIKPYVKCQGILSTLRFFAWSMKI